MLPRHWPLSLLLVFPFIASYCHCLPTSVTIVSYSLSLPIIDSPSPTTTNLHYQLLTQQLVVGCYQPLIYLLLYSSLIDNTSGHRHHLTVKLLHSHHPPPIVANPHSLASCHPVLLTIKGTSSQALFPTSIDNHSPIYHTFK